MIKKEGPPGSSFFFSVLPLLFPSLFLNAVFEAKSKASEWEPCATDRFLLDKYQQWGHNAQPLVQKSNQCSYSRSNKPKHQTQLFKRAFDLRGFFSVSEMNRML